MYSSIHNKQFSEHVRGASSVGETNGGGARRLACLRCPPSSAAASQEAEASLVDLISPGKALQWTMDSSSLLLVQGRPHTAAVDAKACLEFVPSFHAQTQAPLPDT